jgi:hypothetical protein
MVVITIIAAAVIAMVISVAPIWSIISPVISVIPRIAVVGITVRGIGVVIPRPVIARPVIARPVKSREWNGKCKGKVSTGACGWCGKERQPHDGEDEDYKLLHIEMDGSNVSRIQEIVSG